MAYNGRPKPLHMTNWDSSLLSCPLCQSLWLGSPIWITLLQVIGGVTLVVKILMLNPKVAARTSTQRRAFVYWKEAHYRLTYYKIS
jgi:hypothetical protein